MNNTNDNKESKKAGGNFETLAIRVQSERTSQREHSVPLYLTSSFVFEDAEQARALFANEQEGNIYSRFSNPNNDEFIHKMCLLEGTEDGFATATGMAAMFVSMAAFLNSGDHIIISRSVFGSTHQIVNNIFPRWNIEHTFVDLADFENWGTHIRNNTKMIFVETPSNPALDLVDIEKLVALANNHNILVNVDNCFATPYLQNPAKFGVHLVTHSATKFIDGQGRVLGGCILGSKEHVEKVRFFARHTGPALSPFNGWVLSKSLETLAVRMEKHCSNALYIAEQLEKNESINWVKYPFLKSHVQHDLAKKQMLLGGGIVSFEVKGGLTAGQQFLNALRMISFSANLGDTRSIATHPASTTHSKISAEERTKVGITDGLIRLSVGLENIDDILKDIEQALMKTEN
jgi:O-succinylhomoserine sulfhydrylase